MPPVQHPINKIIIINTNKIEVDTEIYSILEEELIDTKLELNTVNYISLEGTFKLSTNSFNFYYSGLKNNKVLTDIFFETGLPTGASYSCVCQTAAKELLEVKELGTIWNIDGSIYTGVIPSSFTLKLENGSTVVVPFSDMLILVAEDYPQYPSLIRRLFIKFKIPNFCRYFYNFLDLSGFANPEYISNLYAAYLDFCEPLIYFTSEVYPIHVLEQLTSSAAWISGYSWKPPDDSMDASIALVSGALTPTVSYGSYGNYGGVAWDGITDRNNTRESEWLDSSIALTGGALTVTVMYGSYYNYGAISGDTDEHLQSSISLTGGTMTVTAGYISYDNYGAVSGNTDEHLQASIALVSGSLT